MNKRSAGTQPDPDLIGFYSEIIFLIGTLLSIYASILTLKQKQQQQPLPVFPE